MFVFKIKLLKCLFRVMLEHKVNGEKLDQG